ncbi:hypothetical protein LZZ85_13860 [Terrimonas sp. NA20]|uniref:HEAT repeat domain-containing protein n=1 Tax=Terrimonas ginsenosidimutans TaxID=2908004 RepID=A0ABS9KSS6_9BACT|nr:hypothetical protein [Terrimonas ginsenosidimutans]MCG2615381.1 hypothetical protein [Terrimonas ginsenosidimutans]
MNTRNFLSIFILTCIISCSNKTAVQDGVVSRIADYNIFEYEVTGLVEDSSEQWKRYDSLLAGVTEEYLVKLCDHRSPVIRAYAFSGLIRKKSSHIFRVLREHIHDTASFTMVTGCFSNAWSVTDFYLQNVGYYYKDSSSYRIDPEQRAFLDSLMLFGNEITLRRENYNAPLLHSRAYMLEHIPHTPSYYKRLREIVTAGVIEALPALAKFHNEDDVPLIKKVYEIDGSIGNSFVFKAITNFPHPDLFPIVEQEIENSLLHDDYSGTSPYPYYQALVQYKTQRTRELLVKAISRTEREDQQRLVRNIRYLLKENPDKIFEGL